MMTFMALIKFTALEFAVCGIATIGTDKASWPTQLEQRGTALLLCTVRFKEFLQTQALLKLNGILRHGAILLVLLMFYYSSLAGGIAENHG